MTARPAGSGGSLESAGGGDSYGAGPAVDPAAPYARLAVVGLVGRRRAGRRGEEWLLLRRVGDSEWWDPPGGRVERGEDLETAVRREVQEETGLPVSVAGPCYAYLTYHKGERLVAVSMACRTEDGDQGIRLEEENATDWRWATAAEWEGLAREGSTSWEPKHVRVATRLASTIWEAAADDEG